MRVIQAPEALDGPELSVYLSGGIPTNDDWHARFIALLADSSLVLIDPRRINYPWEDPAAVEVQVRWERRHLRQASAILFWFPPETLAPITLYELGAYSMTDKPLFVGVHPDYQRRIDVMVQTGLARPDAPILSTLEELAARIRNWCETQETGQSSRQKD